MLKKIKFKNKIFSKKELKHVIHEAFTNYGISRSSLLADEIKELGFYYATKSGISLSIEDLKIPPTKKDLLLTANSDILKSDLSYARGEITSVERFQKVIDTWNKTSETLKDNLVTYFRQTDPLNPIYLMAFSGARGNLSQVRQLVGMRGLMSDPNGQIIDIPIIHNFREGLTITDYIMSAYGARKGVVDTALRTADSGYLTRRLIDVAQDIIIREHDCFTKRSIKIYKNENSLNFHEKIIGRTINENLYSEKFNKILISKGQQITSIIADEISKDEKIKAIRLSSPLTCESTRSICQKCYGWNLSDFKLIELGEAIGIIAAQSIGEPGTQLTMRTFHTGGIFTSDASLQIRAKKTGVFSLDENIQTKTKRTLYGSILNILERETIFTITDYTNKKFSLKLPADSSIFVKNKSFVKEGELIAELPQKNQQTTKSRKNILAPHAGEFYFEKGNVFWILSGEVYDIPNNTLFNKFLLNEKITKKDNLFHFKLINKKAGFLKLIKNRITKTTEIIQIVNCLQIFKSMPVFYDKKINKLVLEISTNLHYLLNSPNEVKKSNKFIIGEKISSKYFTSLGGQIIFANSKFFEFEQEYQAEILKKNGKILFIPQENYTINKDKSLLLVPHNTKLTDPNTELISGIFSKTNGVFQIKESNQILQEIQIKPCFFIEFLNLKEYEIDELKKIDKKLYFPGEILFEDILIEGISNVEFIKTRSGYAFLIRQIQIFNIAKPKISHTNKNLSLNFIRIHSLAFKSNIKEEKTQNFSLINERIYCKNENKNNIVYKTLINSTSKNHKENEKKLIIKKIEAEYSSSETQIYRGNKNQTFYLSLILEEVINIPNFLSKKLDNEDLKLALYIKNMEYAEENTILGLISLIPKTSTNVEKIVKKNNPTSKILILTKNNYQTYFCETNSFYVNENDMIKIGSEISPSVKTKYSGKIIEQNLFKLKIHKGTPFFKTTSTKLYKNSGNFIKQDELLGMINFEQIVTGDIVQGLPKIEEILEARKPQNAAYLTQNPGIVLKIEDFKGGQKPGYLIVYSNNYEPKKIAKNVTVSNFCDKKKVKIRESIIAKKNDFIYVGQPLTEGSVNPHNLLITYFSYYKNFTDDYQSTYLSFKNIQILLVQKVQQVYNSQGVLIADKHLEVIIKKITSKVKITKTGSSSLLPGEIIELKQIEYINIVLKNAFKPLALYYPILLGITKASLLSDSFISAASFQETTKILTAAAIEGKIDWLRGLKENVIIGRLIPVGTGFRKEVSKK